MPPWVNQRSKPFWVSARSSGKPRTPAPAAPGCSDARVREQVREALGTCAPAGPAPQTSFRAPSARAEGLSGPLSLTAHLNQTKIVAGSSRRGVDSPEDAEQPGRRGGCGGSSKQKPSPGAGARRHLEGAADRCVWGEGDPDVGAAPAGCEGERRGEGRGGGRGPIPAPTPRAQSRPASRSFSFLCQPRTRAWQRTRQRQFGSWGRYAPHPRRLAEPG